MKVVLGSRNKDKKKILKSALKELHLDIEIVGIDVESGISGQPLDKKVTKKGAVNRARNAKIKKPNADFWFGLEGGLHDYEEGYRLVTFACLVDKNKQKFIGEGEEIELPQEVSDKVRQKGWFGEIIREYAKDREINESLITRRIPFTQAIQNAYGECLKACGNIGYRKKSSAIIIDKDNNFLIVQLTTYGPDDWNFAGGGIEEGETEKRALLRELQEELGTNKFEIIKKSKETIKYEWPAFVITESLKTKGKTWRGQEVKQFFVRFMGEREDIKPNPDENIREIKWVKKEELKNYFNFPNQLEQVERAIQEFFAK